MLADIQRECLNRAFVQVDMGAIDGLPRISKIEQPTIGRNQKNGRKT